MTLTEDLLLDAACRLDPDFNRTAPNRGVFMCFTVQDAGKQAGLDWRDVHEEFTDLLDEHGVDTCGSLLYRKRGVFRESSNAGFERQCLRFMFLHFLAYSQGNPRRAR